MVLNPASHHCSYYVEWMTQNRGQGRKQEILQTCFEAECQRTGIALVSLEMTGADRFSLYTAV